MSLVIALTLCFDAATIQLVARRGKRSAKMNTEESRLAVQDVLPMCFPAGLENTSPNYRLQSKAPFFQT